MRATFLKSISLILFVILLITALPQSISHAEDASTATTEPTQEVTSQKVKIKSSDGLEIVGLFYPLATTTKAPAILLLHDGVSDKTQWVPFVPTFVQAGYNVLVIDQRGAGETPKSATASNSAELQDQDMAAVIAWMRQQATIDPDAIALIGARLGANFAIRACAADDQCHTVVALTPATDFFGIKTEDAIKSMKKDKSIFIVASEFGENGAKNVKQLVSDTANEINVMARLYGLGFEYGTDMLKKDPNLMPMILLWLKTYNHS